MPDQKADRRILMAAVDEVAELFALMDIHGFESDHIKAEVRRLLKRLRRLNRELDEYDD